MYARILFETERIHQYFTSNYDEKVKLCVKDFMNNISKFERIHACRPLLRNGAILRKVSCMKTQTMKRDVHLKGSDLMDMVSCAPRISGNTPLSGPQSGLTAF